MKKDIFRKFITILGIALLVNSAVSYIMISRVLLDNTKESMRYTLEILDKSLDYEGDLEEQLHDYEERITNKEARFTIITVSGEVCADNSADAWTMPNHSDREEFAQALEKGFGTSKRYSGTLGIHMFYMAICSSNGEYLLRVAIPSFGMADYIAVLMPAFLSSLLTAVLISMILAERFSRKISEPLKDISEKISEMRRPGEILEFEAYPYDEMNIIARNTTQMTLEVSEYLKKIEKERTIRQEFFSNVSHELKTPITSIYGFAELMQKDMVTDETKKKEFLERILKETKRMTNLINDILMISRLETREAEVVMTDISMPELLEETIEEIRPAAEGNGIEISYNSEVLLYHANLQQLQELVSNLISNAVKYNKPQGRVHVSVCRVREEMVIEVYDTGIGIPEESIPRIFERFYRVDKSRSRGSGGTGLGLSIVKHVVEYYNGRIEIKSKIDTGTTITVYLPIET